MHTEAQELVLHTLIVHGNIIRNSLTKAIVACLHIIFFSSSITVMCECNDRNQFTCDHNVTYFRAKRDIKGGGKESNFMPYLIGWLSAKNMKKF